MNSRYYFVTILISISSFCHGQVLIKADTISFDCREVYNEGLIAFLPDKEK